MGKLNRVGEEGINNFGSKMIITKYNAFNDMEVYFPKYDWKVKHVQYGNFKIGNVKCPYEPRTLGYGYIGEGKYASKENGKITKCYTVWHGMLVRCYDEKYQEKYHTYIGCTVCDEWLNFQNFAEWYYNNYYEVKDGELHLDKDILKKGNKIYSPDTCVLIPEQINTLFIKNNKHRGNNPIGVCPKNKRYQASCRNDNGYYLGLYDTQEDAFKAYKIHKEKIIKETIDAYEGIIPEPTYSKLKDVMYNYKVEIND